MKTANTINSENHKVEDCRGNYRSITIKVYTNGTDYPIRCFENYANETWASFIPRINSQILKLTNGEIDVWKSRYTMIPFKTV